MLLTRDYKETIAKRADLDPVFAKALIEEANTLSLSGDRETADLLHHDFLNCFPTETQPS
jgi:hypothetical protein